MIFCEKWPKYGVSTVHNGFYGHSGVPEHICKILKIFHVHSDSLQHHKATKYSKITVFWPVGPRKGKQVKMHDFEPFFQGLLSVPKYYLVYLEVSKGLREGISVPKL